MYFAGSKYFSLRLGKLQRKSKKIPFSNRYLFDFQYLKIRTFRSCSMSEKHVDDKKVKVS